jgi:hypothetical protein
MNPWLSWRMQNTVTWERPCSREMESNRRCCPGDILVADGGQSKIWFMDGLGGGCPIVGVGDSPQEAVKRMNIIKKAL